MADRRGSTAAAFLRGESGAVTSLEFVLLAIPAIIIVLALVQMAQLARASVILEQAAYAAARSALVHRCRPISPMAGPENLLQAAAAVWGAANCDETESNAQALRAARLAVIPLASSNGKARARQGGCGFPEALVDFMVGAGVREGLREAVAEMACYAFEAENVTVTVDWVTAVPGVSLLSALPPIEATVTFRMPVFVPVRGIFSDGRRGDGTHYRTLTATARVL